MKPKREYRCQKCGCEDFISKPFKFKTYQHQNGKLVFQYSEFIETKLELSCIECSEPLEFDKDDIIN